MKIHKEGKKTLIMWFIILTIINASAFLLFHTNYFTFLILVPSIVLYLMMINFYKSPQRSYQGDFDNKVNAPTDGKVVVIERVFEKDYLQQEAIQVSIFMSFFNAHSNWIPVTGKIVHFSHQDGNFHAAYLPKSSTENERTNIVIEMLNGTKILTRQIAGAVARRIVTYVKEGDNCKIGEPLGFIKLGSRMDIFLPLDSKILVKIGDEVHANVTFLAELPEINQQNEETNS